MKKRLTDPQIVARSFTERFGVDCLDRPTELASKIGLKVKPVDCQSFEGALLRVRDLNIGTILLSTRISHAGRRRFTLAHEIGHYLLPGHGREEGYCRGSGLDSWEKGLSRIEEEANSFAAEVLMPVQKIKHLLQVEPQYEIAAEIADLCASSLSASSYRLAALTTHPFAVVWSEEGKFKWCKKSDEFDYWIRPDKCDRETLVFRCFSGEPVPTGYDRVPASAWLSDARIKDDANILEQSKPLPAYNAVISFLLIDELIERVSPFGDEWE